MRQEKQRLFCPLNEVNLKRGQVIFLIVSLTLVLFIFLVIILGNLTSSSLQFGYSFRNFISLRSLSFSGLRYALYQINQNPNFTTSSAVVLMPQGSFNYSVSNVGSYTTKEIRIQASLANSAFTKILNATATIDSLGTILDIEINEE